MGISRDSRHKRRLTGGRRKIHQKKRKAELARPPANTKLDKKIVRPVRVRGGNYKYRALALDSGNFSWASEARTSKTRVLDVVYNASNNELVRTKTLVKGAVILVDATPFRQWYEQFYSVNVTKTSVDTAAKEGSKHVQKTVAQRQKIRTLDPRLQEQFGKGRLLAVIASRPGQSGRCDGYILEGAELEFYQRKLAQRKK